MEEKIRVLMIEDDEEDFDIVRDLLSKSKIKYHIDLAENYNKGIKAIKSNKYDVYLLDYLLGPENAIDMLKELKQGTNYLAPIILITGHINIDPHYNIIESGASDYISKDDLSTVLLDRVIRYSIERKKIEHKLKNNEEILNSIFETTTAGICLLSEDFHVERFNTAFSNIFGLDCNNLFNVQLDKSFIFKKYNENIYNNVESEDYSIKDVIVDFKQPFEGRVICQITDKHLDCLVSCVRAVIKNGHLKIKYIFTIVDISKQKYAESRLAISHRKLSEAMERYAVDHENIPMMMEWADEELERLKMV